MHPWPRLNVVCVIESPCVPICMPFTPVFSMVHMCLYHSGWMLMPHTQIHTEHPRWRAGLQVAWSFLVFGLVLLVTEMVVNHRKVCLFLAHYLLDLNPCETENSLCYINHARLSQSLIIQTWSFDVSAVSFLSLCKHTVPVKLLRLWSVVPVLLHTMSLFQNLASCLAAK